MGKTVTCIAVVMMIGLLAACRRDSPELAEATGTPAPSMVAEVTTAIDTPAPSPTWPPFLQSPAPPGAATVAGITPPAETAAPPTPPPPPPISSPPPGPVCVVAPPPGWAAVVVRPGDTIGRLAGCVGTSAAAIVAVNCLPNNGNLIYSGQSLYLPGVCAPAAAPTVENRIEIITTPAPPQPGEDGQVIVDPAKVAPGGFILIRFSNFSRNELVTASFVPLATNVALTTTVQANTNADGVGQVGFYVPLSFPTGRIAVRAGDRYQSGEGLLTILPPTATPTGTATPTSAPTITETVPATGTPTATLEPDPTLTPTPDGAPGAGATPTETTEPPATSP